MASYLRCWLLSSTCRLIVFVAPYANVVFQREFDSGEQATALIDCRCRCDFCLWRYPLIFFFGTPCSSSGLGLVDRHRREQCLWGLAVYACYAVSIWVVDKYARGSPLNGGVAQQIVGREAR